MTFYLKGRGQDGYIALMSSIIISALLIVIATAVSASGFFSRFNVLSAEYKQRSLALAQGCEQAALLRLAENQTPLTGNVIIGSDVCSIFSVQQNFPVAGQITIQTKAVFQDAVSNIQIIVNSQDLSTVSWQELPSL